MPHPIVTKNNGKVVFERYFIGAGDSKQGIPGGRIGVLDNGSWVYYPSAQPIESKEIGSAILSGINPRVVKDFESWWDNQDNEDPAREIVITPDGRLLYGDTRKEVDRIGDIYDYYPPDSPVLETALRLFRMGEEERQEAALAVASAPMGVNSEEAAKLGETVRAKTRERVAQRASIRARKRFEKKEK